MNVLSDGEKFCNLFLDSEGKSGIFLNNDCFLLVLIYEPILVNDGPFKFSNIYHH